MARPKEIVTQKMFSDRDAFLRFVCDEMKVSALEVMSKKRTLRVSMARHIIMWALYKYSGTTSSQVGYLMARDHATVLYAIGAVEANSKMPYHKELRKVLDLVKQKGEVLCQE